MHIWWRSAMALPGKPLILHFTLSATYDFLHSSILQSFNSRYTWIRPSSKSSLLHFVILHFLIFRLVYFSLLSAGICILNSPNSKSSCCCLVCANFQFSTSMFNAEDSKHSFGLPPLPPLPPRTGKLPVPLACLKMVQTLHHFKPMFFRRRGSNFDYDTTL